jgi:hypothetical protein
MMQQVWASHGSGLYPPVIRKELLPDLYGVTT